MSLSVSNIFYYIFKILFGLSLIGLGIRNQTEYQKNINIAESSLLRINSKLGKFKDHLNDFLKLHSSLLIPAGIGIILGIKKTKIFAVFFTILQILFIDNFYFYKDPKFLRNTLIHLSILGSVLYIN